MRAGSRPIDHGVGFLLVRLRCTGGVCRLPLALLFQMVLEEGTQKVEEPRIELQFVHIPTLAFESLMADTCGPLPRLMRKRYFMLLMMPVR